MVRAQAKQSQIAGLSGERRGHIAIESDSFEFMRQYPSQKQMISFQIPVGLPADQPKEGIVSRKLDKRDVPEGILYLGQLRGRSLAVAPAKFAAQIEGVLAESYG